MQHHFFFPWFPGMLGTFLLVFCIIPYFLPTIIAFARKKDNAGGVFALNFFLGWTFIGWIASLIWGLSSNTRPPARPILQYAPNSSGLILLSHEKAENDDRQFDQYSDEEERNGIFGR